MQKSGNWTLTADVDDLTGTANDDTFNAGLTVAGVETLNTFDRVDGGEGTDTLNATLNGNDFNAGTVFSTAVENVENLYFRTIADSTVSMAGYASAEQVWADRTQNNLTVGTIVVGEELGNLVTAGVKGGEGNTFTINYDVDSAEDVAQDIVLEGANRADATGAAQGTLAITNAGTADFDTVNINNSGESFFNAVTNDSLAAAVELNVEGTGSLQVDTALAAAFGTVNAGDFEGDLTLDLSNNASDLDVTTGAGDDKITIDGTNLDNSDSIDLGAGDDTIALTGLTAAGALDGLDLSPIANTEGLELVGAVAVDDTANAGDGEVLSLGDFGNVTFKAAVDGANVAVADLLFDTDASALELNFEGTVAVTTGVNFAVSDSVSDLTLTADESVIGDFANVALTNEADANGDTESLESLTLADVSEPDATTGVLTPSSYDVALGDATAGLNGLNTINLNGASGVDGNDDGVATQFVVNAANADYDGAVSINVSNVGGASAYNNAQATVAETFTFSGDIVDGATFTINNFNVSTGSTADKLDLSAYNNVGFAQTASNEITITSDDFDGEIVVQGIQDIDQGFFEANAIA